MDQRNLISSMVFMLLAAFVLIASLSLGIGSMNNPQAGFVPFGIGLLMIVFSFVLFVITYRNKSITVRWTELWHKLNWAKSVMVAVFLVGYVALLPWAGYLIATGVLMLIFFRLTSMKIWTAALGAALSVGFSYGLFHFLLKTPLPKGLWGF